MLYKITSSTRPVVLATIPDTRNHSASFGISATPVNFKPSQLSVGSLWNQLSWNPAHWHPNFFLKSNSLEESVILPVAAITGPRRSSWTAFMQCLVILLHVRYLGLRFALFVGFNPRFFLLLYVPWAGLFLFLDFIPGPGLMKQAVSCGQQPVVGWNDFLYLKLYAIVQKKTLFFSLLQCFHETTLCRWSQDILCPSPFYLDILECQFVHNCIRYYITLFSVH
jgi:hypothetical protein